MVRLTTVVSKNTQEQREDENLMIEVASYFLHGSSAELMSSKCKYSGCIDESARWISVQYLVKYPIFDRDPM